MLAQRRLANLKLSSYLGLGDAKSRSTLNKRALGIGRHIFGGHFTFPKGRARVIRKVKPLRLSDQVETATARYWTAMERHKLYISEHGEDMPEVRDWRWSL
jgi:hypothetical protein